MHNIEKTLENKLQLNLKRKLGIKSLRQTYKNIFAKKIHNDKTIIISLNFFFLSFYFKQKQQLASQIYIILVFYV
jgi:hypothetical protein